MSLLKDIEKGDEEQDNLAPLLERRFGGERLRPPRPPRHGQQDPNGLSHNHPNLQNLQLGPSSEISTPDTTPLLDAEESWPRKWRRSDRRLRRLNTELLEAIDAHDVEEVERLLKEGANPNATCRLDLVSACHIAALNGGDALGLLIKFGAEKHRLDRLGRTPLHLAAFAGNSRQVAILLDYPEDMQKRVESSDMSSEAEEEVKKLCPSTRDLVNVRCNLGNVEMILPKNWKDNIDHNCMDIKGSLPLLQPGWTPLHVAASCARQHCVRLLLAAGANPNVCDVVGRTVLDVTGSGYYYGHGISSKCFTEVIRTLIKAGGKFNSMKTRGQNVDTPLHTAVVLENIESIQDLLDAGVSIACLDSAGQTPLHVCVRKELEEPLQILANYAYKDADPMSAMVDVKDWDGHTVLQAAVEASWVPGVCIALEAGADVTMRANDGETPIHSAAALGNLDVLNEILSVSKQRDFIDCQNKDGETALFKAIVHGHLECVEALINEGASTKITLPGDVNVLHVATENQHVDILKFLLDDDNIAENMINSLTSPEKKGFGPIHYAVLNNNVECIKLLISKNADIRLRTTSNPHKSGTPLHIASVKNFKEVAKVIVNNDRTTIYEVDSMGWYPLHSASHHGSRDVIMLLLQEGADLSGYTDGPKKYRRSAIDMIINNLSRPTEFMEEVFDMCISSNGQHFQDAACEITIDYRILMPTICEMEQMKVIKALLKTGNRNGQKRLLLHPLVESFLYLKWKALLPFFYTIIAVYSMFVGSLTIFSFSVFFYKDTYAPPPRFLNPHVWAHVIYFTVLLTLMQEILYMNVKSTGYLFQLETWIKFSSIILAAILPPTVAIALSTEDWPRHVATCALLLSWIELMFLLSRFPNWGYYVLMFGKVATNVIKILLTFGFLVIGFSLSFMIQFRSEMPFDGPWAAIVKTMVMMTSEFDYEGLFDEEHTKELATSLIVVRLIFLIFLVLAAIVLMNLMVGVAVNDINDLEVLGNIRRLAKQVEFLSTLDNLVYNKFFNTILPKRVNESIKNKKKVLDMTVLCPGRPRWKHYKNIPSRIRNAILDKVQKQNKQIEEENRFEEFSKLMREIHEAITSNRTEENKKIEYEKEDKLEQKLNYDNAIKRLNSLENSVTKVEDRVICYVKESQNPIEQLNVKVDQLSIEMEEIKLFLTRLESKLNK